MEEKNMLNEIVIIESSPETYFIYAMRNAIRIAKCAYPTAKKVVLKREGVEVAISDLDTEKSLYEKFIKAQKERVMDTMGCSEGF